MRKRILYFVIFSALFPCAMAATRDARLTNTTGYNYNYMYPYMNNSMRTNLNPGVTNGQSSNLIDTVVKTEKLPSTTQRRVVSRTNTSRSARSATMAPKQTSTNQSQRRVVARTNTVRSATTAGTARRGNGDRGYNVQTVINNSGGDRSNPTYSTRSAATNLVSTQTSERISSVRCMTDYTECMDDYCKRENTKYNRCYCSSKLSQIDATYQPAIENLITQILTLQSENNWSDSEMDEYWMSTVGKYSGENSWTNLDSALDIDWSSMESRVRGQNAFNTGHEYCVQHLRGCFYMASNMRDAYRSEIARDCSTYESSLSRIKNAAESIIKANK
ncbi:MAG: hypothetical protein IKW57_00840 [Alphaproteobacteria bacterium]|nr:hypothetical protein [Alphaproteobacteria bacterium]